MVWGWRTADARAGLSGIGYSECAARADDDPRRGQRMKMATFSRIGWRPLEGRRGDGGTYVVSDYNVGAENANWYLGVATGLDDALVLGGKPSFGERGRVICAIYRSRRRFHGHVALPEVRRDGAAYAAVEDRDVRRIFALGGGGQTGAAGGARVALESVSSHRNVARTTYQLLFGCTSITNALDPPATISIRVLSIGLLRHCVTVGSPEVASRRV